MKKGLLKRVIAGILAAMIVIPSLSMPEVQAAEKSDIEYEIYPKPQEITYSEGDFIIKNDINIVYDEGIDRYTKEKLKSVLKSKGIEEPSVTDAVNKGSTNILVGIKDSKGYVDTYAGEKGLLDEAMFRDHLNPYVLDVKDNVITIVGKDTDSAFYGIVSLMHIFNQMDGKTIRNLRINDYADTKTRGFIEGYYGIPWSNEDRMSLMEFGGQFKMTSYIFAPKDDPYHSARWREPYPDDKLAEIAEMAEVGNANKCRFVWTIHPFMTGGMTAETYDADIAAIKAKFEQLYDVGIRQFGVLADDAGALPRDVIVRTMNDLQKWTEEKGDVYNLVFCPGGYNDSWQGDYSELNQYDAGFPESVQIFWTGQAVCKPVEQVTLDNFRRKALPAGTKERRSPLFWLNWPVNDINMNRLLMGEGTLLHNDINVEDLSGVVTNPMQDAEPSKVAIFAVADYAWNVEDFNSAQSWEDSFKYIDPDAGESLRILAKHMSDPSPNGHGLVLEESKELQPLLEAYLSALESGSVTEEQSAALIKEFETIAAACDDFHVKSRNARLKEQVLPFSESLKDQAEAAILFIKTQQAIQENNVTDVWSNYSQATANLADSKTHLRPKWDNKLVVMTNALPGSKRITPFLNKVNEIVSPTVNSMLDETKIITSLITNRNDTPDGALETLTDGNEATIVTWKNPNTLAKDTYVGLKYSKPVTLNDITFIMGSAGNAADTFASGKIQYTEDGKEWKDIPNTEYTDNRAVIEAEGLNLEIMGIRLIATANTENRWLGCKEIIVNKSAQPEKPAEEKISGTGFYNESLMGIRNGNVGMMTDGALDKNGNAYVGFAKPGTDTTIAESYVGLRFAQATEINKFVVNQGTGDHISEGRLEYQNENDEWVKIADYTGIGEDFNETFDTVKAKAIRLVNGRDVSIWWRIYEMGAYKVTEENPEVVGEGCYNTENMSIRSGTVSAMTDKNPSTSVSFAESPYKGITGKEDSTLEDAYVGLQFDKLTKVNTIRVSQGTGDHIVEGKLEYKNADDQWVKIGDYTNIGAEFRKTFDTVEAKEIRLVNTQWIQKWWQINEIEAENAKIEKNSVIYTNVDELKMLTTEVADDRVAFDPASDITLKSGEYLGVVFDRIKDIINIDANAVEGLTLQSSMNGVVWTDCDADADKFEDARYVRMINSTQSDITFNLTTFVVESYEVSPISVLETNFGTWEGGDHMNAFDHDRTTQVILASSQTAGKFITWDLGQVIDLDSLKLVLHDGEGDFPRHAKVSVSTDKQQWTEVMLIGDQNAANEGEKEGTDAVSDLFPVHEVSYNTKEAVDLGTKARYIKFEITRTKEGPDKWVRLREIELNGGNQYIPEINDPTVIGDGAVETAGNSMLNMIDGEVFTTFKSASEEAGSFTYRISGNTEITKITILQSPTLISNAEVTAEVLKNGNVERVSLGNLNTSMNEFNTSSFQNVLSVTVAWEKGKVPEIHEILTSSSKVQTPNKDALREYYNANKDLDTKNWTPKSAKSYTEAAAHAKAILESEFTTQLMVNSALAEFKNAVENKVEKPDMNAFAEAVKEITDRVLAEKNYLPRTWRVYAERLAAAEAAKENENISQAELDVILQNLSDAADGLVFEVSSIEELKILVSDAASYKDLEVDYAQNSYEDLKKAIAEAEDMIAADAAERQKPEEVKKALKALQDALERFDAWTELDAAIKDAKDISTTGYTPASVKVLKDAITAAEELADTKETTLQDITDAVTAITEAVEGLIPSEESAGVLAELERLGALKEDDYTAASYHTLQNTIAEVRTALDGGENDYQSYLKKLKEAEEALVNISELKKEVEYAEGLDTKIYTDDSKTGLNAKLEEAKALYENGTSKEVADMVKALKETVAALAVTPEYANEQIQEYKESLSGNFTEESKNAVQSSLNKVAEEAEAGSLTLSKLDGYKAELKELKEALVDTTELLDAIAQAEKITNEGYTEASFQKYKKMIEEAKGLLKNGKVTEIADMVEALNNPNSILEKKGDFTKLQELVDQYKNMDLSGYTKESADNLRTEIAKAEFMIQQGDFSQKEIDAQIDAIKAAVKALQKPSQNQTNESSTPKTGDSANLFIWMILLIGAAAAGMTVRKNKNRTRSCRR